ncbi:MAG TPA: TetR/AcrR family transcriptional regulator [Candidatus Syntrophosphaera sp.]|nr:TetR/AcrR family transcriptional regulator [Candidatus Syntrophosphaera sp.]HRR98099.1 TetR/AcrR family transcriptional regulator [Candidatus Syntrophosphaera sp.]
MTERQEQIILTAIALIAREGYKNLTIKKLASELHLSEAALYRHFVNKEDLLLSIMHYFEDISRNVLQEIQKTKLNPLEKVHFFIMNRYELFTSNPDLAQVMFSDELFYYDPVFFKQFQKISMNHREVLLNFIEEAQKEGFIQSGINSTQLFTILIGSMRFLITQWNLSGRKFDLVKEGDSLFQTIKNLIAEKKI